MRLPAIEDKTNRTRREDHITKQVSRELSKDILPFFSKGGTIIVRYRRS